MRSTLSHRDRRNPRNNLKLKARLEGAVERHELYAKLGTKGADLAAKRTREHLASLT